MNQRVAARGSWIVHQYGCCGTFFFFVADAATRAIRKRTLPSLEAALEWIADREAEREAVKQKDSAPCENVILSVTEVSDESHA